jgi:hypothetical protein
MIYRYVLGTIDEGTHNSTKKIHGIPPELKEIQFFYDKVKYIVGEHWSRKKRDN